MYSTAFWCLSFYYCVFLALLRNHYYSFHRTKWRMVTSIWRGSGPVATRKPSFFFAEIQIRCKCFSSSPRGKPLLPLWEIGSKRRSIISPIKSSHLCRTSRYVWLSSSACDHCCDYQLICIMTISNYTTGARAEMTRQLGSCTVKKWVLAPVV